MSIVSEMKLLYYKSLNVKTRVSLDFTNIFNPEQKKLLNINKEFENIHMGQRCFILGNGPSLKDENLIKLEKEYVFTVNQIARNKDFEHIKPNYHFWADENFFKIDESKGEDLELLDIMRGVYTETNQPICFYPIEQYNFIKKYNLDKDLKTRYFYAWEFFHTKYKKNFNYSKSIPRFGTVVLWCISMAIFMGFSEIYLLGCDNTGLINTIKAMAKSDEAYEYSYDISENEKKRCENLSNYEPLELYVRSYLSTINEYQTMNNYCNKRGIKLINCSSTTVIDSIPRKSLSAVLGEEAKKI